VGPFTGNPNGGEYFKYSLMSGIPFDYIEDGSSTFMVNMTYGDVLFDKM
jgi:hypothetical protein